MCRAAPLSCSKSTSQIQETSCPSAIRSLSAIKNELAWPNWIADGQDFIESGGVLGQQQHGGALVDDGAFHPAERRGEVAQGGGALHQRDVQRLGRGQRQNHVVGVVEAREWHLDVGLLLAIGDPQPHTVHATDRNAGRSDVRRRPREVAPRAAIVTDVPEVDAVEDERAAAARAEFRVGAMAELGLQQ